MSLWTLISFNLVASSIQQFLLPGAAPEAVYLSYEVKDNGAPFCIGTILASDKILTAAHCVVRNGSSSIFRYFLSDVEVGAGISNFKESREIAQKFHLWQVFVHPQYNWSSGTNDLSILRLTGRLAFNNYISRTVVHAFHELNSGGVGGPTYCDILAWDTNTSCLFAAPVSVVDLSICSDSIQIPKGLVLDEKEHICTRNMFKCRSQILESILVCSHPDEDRHFLAGIAHTFQSFRVSSTQSAGCNLATDDNFESLTVFQSIRPHEKWIKNVLGTSPAQKPTWTNSKFAGAAGRKMKAPIATLSWLLFPFFHE